MSFTGTLDDFSPVEIISVLDILDKSGKLRLTRDGDEGMVVFRSGKIIYAASSGFRENLGTMLLARGLIDELQLVEALGKQVTSNTEKRLGNILIEMGALSQEALNDVVLEQVIRVVADFGHWDTGTFEFDTMAVADHGEVELESHELWAPLGLSPNHVLLRLAQDLDEADKEIAPPPNESSPAEASEPGPGALAAEDPNPVIEAAAASVTEPPAAAAASVPEVEAQEPEPDVTEPEEIPEATVAVPEPTPIERPAPTEPDLDETEEARSLSDFVGELRGPQVKGEMLQKLLQHAAEAFGRCVLFSVRQDRFRSIAQTGQALAERTEDSSLLRISLERSAPSILNRCASTGHTVMAKLPQEAGDQRILDALGGPVGEKSVAMPLLVRGETVIILYGDSLLEKLPIGWAENLEGFLAEAARGIEADIQAEIAAEIAAAQSA